MGTNDPAGDEAEPDRKRVQKRARDRKGNRAAATESILSDLEQRFDDVDRQYPISSEDLATEYGSEPIDLPNETETLGDVFDRLAGETFESPAAVRKAVLGEITDAAGDAREASPERQRAPRRSE